MQNFLRISRKIVGSFLCLFVMGMGCADNTPSSKKREALSKINAHRKAAQYSKSNTARRVGIKKKSKDKLTKIVGEVSDMKIVNSGSDDNEIVLEWTASDLKGISGNFDIFRSFGNREHDHIAKTKLYDGKEKMEKFVWKENDKDTGIYTDISFENENLFPLRNFKFQVRFNPLNTKKYRMPSFSNESVGYIVPKNAANAMNDIVENLHYAYQDDCGFFSHFEPKAQSISRKGNFSGFYIRDVENNTVTYSFQNYSHVGAIYINGKLQSKIINHAKPNQKPIMKPVSVAGDLDITGIYKAKVKIIDLEFTDQCSKHPKNGTISIHYNHPHHGIMKAGFKGLLIPKKFLASDLEREFNPKNEEDSAL